MVTFAIFFLVPKLAGQTTQQIALRYVGRGASQADIIATEKRLHLGDALPSQYWRFVSGIVAGQDYSYGPDVAHCPPPCLGYSFRNSQPVWGLITNRLPVTLS